jgi:hypothetical protein
MVWMVTSTKFLCATVVFFTMHSIVRTFLCVCVPNGGGCSAVQPACQNKHVPLLTSHKARTGLGTSTRTPFCLHD